MTEYKPTNVLEQMTYGELYLYILETLEHCNGKDLFLVAEHINELLEDD